MKTHILLLSILSVFILSCSSNKNIVRIPANGEYEIENPPYEYYHATLNKKSISNIDVKVISRESGEQVKGFGLGMAGNAKIFVEKENKLVLVNNSNSKAKVKNIIEEVIPKRKEAPKVSETSISKEVPTISNYIEFTLRNKSGKSIALIIPNVMNPNLLPLSNSGVSLKVGQEILFKYKGKKRVLLVVTNDIKNGDVIDVAKLLRQRKKEIDTK